MVRVHGESGRTAHGPPYGDTAAIGPRHRAARERRLKYSVCNSIGIPVRLITLPVLSHRISEGPEQMGIK